MVALFSNWTFTFQLQVYPEDLRKHKSSLSNSGTGSLTKKKCSDFSERCWAEFWHAPLDCPFTKALSEADFVIKKMHVAWRALLHNCKNDSTETGTWRYRSWNSIFRDNQQVCLLLFIGRPRLHKNVYLHVTFNFEVSEELVNPDKGIRFHSGIHVSLQKHKLELF